MKKALIEPISYVDEMVVLVSKQEKTKINALATELIEQERHQATKPKPRTTRKSKTNAA